MPLYSTPAQLLEISDLTRNFLRLPFGFRSVPGNLLEALVEMTRGTGTERLRTYDFVGVINRQERIGWQIKSLDADTPVTWIRGKLPGKQALIEASFESAEARQALCDTILNYCNDHARASLEKYGLEQIGYIRLINYGTRFRYFERTLISAQNPILFSPAEYQWQWSEPKITPKKEQLPALHGTHIFTGVKHFAWHGQGENQLHFAGEKTWWPAASYPDSIDFPAPTEDERVSLETLAEWLATL
jgi:hypothetical protein